MWLDKVSVRLWDKLSRLQAHRAFGYNYTPIYPTTFEFQSHCDHLQLYWPKGMYVDVIQLRICNYYITCY